MAGKFAGSRTDWKRPSRPVAVELVNIHTRIVEPTTEATLMTLSKHRSAADGHSPFRQVDTFATNQANHHPDSGLEMTLICPVQGLTQQRV